MGTRGPNRLPQLTFDINYVSQVAIKPPSFVFFVREPRSIHFSYDRYLMNQFRKALALDQVPLRFFFKKKARIAENI